MKKSVRWRWVVAALAVLAMVSRSSAEVRTWTDATGKHKTEAEFISAADGKVRLKRADGKEVTVPLTKLSEEDRAYVEEQLASDKDAAPTDADKVTADKDTADKENSAAPDRAAAVKDVLDIAKRFFEDLRTDERDLARATLTAKAQAGASGTKSPLALLPKPDDNARAVKVGKAKIKGTTADVPVQVRAGGALVKTTLHLRFEDDQWRVFALSATMPDGEQTLDFETAPPAGDGEGRQDPLAALVGQPFVLQGYTLDGTPVDITQLKGKVVLVDFWATWCGPCRAEIPNILANYQQYHDQGFEVLAVSIDDDLNELKTFVAAENPPWAVLADKHPMNQASMQQKYGISGIPAFILVGKDGKVATVGCRGELLGQELAKLFAGGNGPAKKQK